MHIEPKNPGPLVKKISVVTSCYNEEENVELLYEAVRKIFERLGKYRYEHIFADNASEDNTAAILRRIAEKDKNVKVILNSRNFGHIRSPHHVFIQARGDAVIPLVCDFQDPPDLIPEFISKWEEGKKIVVGVKARSEESFPFSLIRRLFYRLVRRLSDVRLFEGFHGFGIYDKSVVDVVRKLKDPYPYFRGLVAELGFDPVQIPYTQPQRQRGVTKNNFYTLYDSAMNGFTSYSKVPLRIATMGGFAFSILCLLIGTFYLCYKLLFWESVSFGIAPVILGLFFFNSIILFFVGIVGEYSGAIHTQVMGRPHVVEKERLNFGPDEPLVTNV